METTGEEMTSQFDEEFCDGCLKLFKKIEMYRIDDHDELLMYMCAECYQPEARGRGKRR